MYSVVYFANRREVTAQASTYSRALEKAAVVATTKDRPFPIIVKDDLGRIIQEIKG